MAKRTSKSTARSRSRDNASRSAHAQGGISLFDSYLVHSREPLTVLLFLLPLVVIYEILLVSALRSSGGVVTPDAHRWILTLFEALELGTVGLWLPGVLVLGVLLVWHVVERRPLRVEPSTVGLMWSESIVAALPLLVFSQVALRIPVQAAGGDFDALPLGARIAVSVGAGIYEELLFRLGLIGVLVIVFEDILRTPRRVATMIAVGLSAIAFMAYHPLRGESGALLPSRVVFYLVAGIYFGALFVARGFGIAVGAHAAYDIFAAVLAPGAATDS
ncbi:MAG: hypothetical protein RL136_531 [Planctomycetota bacterium]|jgi:hypothetical protein